MFQADQDPRNNIRSTSSNQIRLNNNNNPSSNKKKFICENLNCPLRGYEFHWCSSPGCPLTNHCHLNGDQCEIIEPSIMTDKDPRYQMSQSLAQAQQSQVNQLNQNQFLASKSQYKIQQQCVNNPSNIQAQVLQSNLFGPQYNPLTACNQTPILNRQSQVFNYDPSLLNNRNTSPILQTPPSYQSKSFSLQQQIFTGMNRQDYSTSPPRGLSMSQTQQYQDDAYDQYNNDCVPIPIVVLKRVYDDRNRSADHYSSVENLNQVNGYQPDEVTENYNNAQSSNTLHSTSTLNIDCEEQNPSRESLGQEQQPSLLQHSPTFDCLINNIIKKYYSDINKRCNANTGSTTNLNHGIGEHVPLTERDQAASRLSNKSELNINLNAEHLSRSSSQSFSNLQGRSSSMPLNRVDKSRNVSFSNLNDPSVYDQSNPNIYTVHPEVANAQRLKDPSQIGEYRSSDPSHLKYEQSEYKKKFDEKINYQDNQDFKRSTFTTQYSNDKRVPEYVNSDNYDLPKFKEFKEYTYKEVTKLIKEYTPSRSKPAPPRYVVQQIKNSPFVQNLNESTESLGQLGLERPETYNTASKSINKSESKENLKQLGFENSSERLKQKSQVTFDLNESLTPSSSETSTVNNSLQQLIDPIKSQISSAPPNAQELISDFTAALQLNSQQPQQQINQIQPQQLQQLNQLLSLDNSSIPVQQTISNLQQQSEQPSQIQLQDPTITPNNHVNIPNQTKEDQFDLNARIEQLINEQKKSNEILQTAIKSLCQAYYNSNGGCQPSN